MVGTMEIFKKLKSINISFYQDSVGSKIFPLGDKCTVSSFHFEEAVSYPYTGLVVVRTRQFLDFDSLDLNCLIVKIDYTVEDKAKAEIKDSRLVWALVKTIQSLPDYQVTEDNKLITYYQYQIALVSPLERLKNYHCNTFYKGLKIHEILRKLLVPGNTTSLPLVSENNINIHKLETVEALNTSKVLIQPNDESYYDFFNKLLIAYGINYILEFDEKYGVKITFSRDQNYCYVESKDSNDTSKYGSATVLGAQRESAIECGKAPDKDTDSKRFAYLNTENYSKSYVALEKTDEIVKSVRQSFLSLETAGNDFEFLKNKQIDEIETNIRTRLNFSRTFLESSGFRDIRVYPGCHLNIIQNSKRVPYVLWSLVTDINISVNDSTKLKIGAISLNGLGAGTKLGCLMPPAIAPDFSSESTSNNSDLDIVEAVVCSQDGSISDGDVATTVDDDYGINNDKFYARFANGDVKLIHSLLNASENYTNKMVQGQQILVLRKNGTYYLYSTKAQSLDINSPSLLKDVDDNSEQIWKGSHNGLIHYSEYNSGREYILSLLMNDADLVDKATVMAAFAQSDTSIHDKNYYEEINGATEDKVAAAIDTYKNAKSALRAKLKELKRTCDEGSFKDIADELPAKPIVLTNLLKTSDSKEDAQEGSKADENNELQKLVEQYNTAFEALNELAGKIDEKCKLQYLEKMKQKESIPDVKGKVLEDFPALDPDAEGIGAQERAERQVALKAKTLEYVEKKYKNREYVRSSLGVQNSGEIRVQSSGSDVIITGDNIKLIGSSSILLSAPTVTLSGSESVVASVGVSNVTVQADGTSIYAPAAYNGFVPTKAGQASSTLSSTLAVKGYSGIEASAFDVNISASNAMALSDGLGGSIGLGFGEVTLKGSNVTISTTGKFNQGVSLAAFSKTLVMDIAASLAGGSDDGYAYPSVQTALAQPFAILSDIGEGSDVAGELSEAKSQLKNPPAGVSKRYLRFNLAQKIIALIFYILDRIYEVCKLIETSMSLHAAKKSSDREKRNAELKDLNGYDDSLYDYETYEQNAYLNPFKNSIHASKLDHIRMYIQHLKFLNGMILAGATCYRSNLEIGSPFGASSIKLSTNSITTETARDEHKMGNVEYAIAPLAGANGDAMDPNSIVSEVKSAADDGSKVSVNMNKFNGTKYDKNGQP